MSDSGDLLAMMTARLLGLEQRVDDLERLETPLVPSPDNLYYDDFRVPATAVNPPGLISDPGWDDTNVGWLFDANSTEQLQVIVQLPHSWAEGSDIEPHVHWQPTTTNTGNVLWRMEYKWVNIDDVDPGTFTTVNQTQAGSGAVNTHQLMSFGTISGAGKTASSIISIKLSRVGGDASDTYTADARLKEFDFHYAIDSFGEMAAP